MKKSLLKISILFVVIFLIINKSNSQGVPEILYYKFNDTGVSVKNYASSPPTGTSTATINGAIKQGSKGICSSRALVGTGNSSSTDYVDTKWTPSLTGSWTIAFWCKNLDSSTTLYYLFGENTASSFRCFSGGVAGAGNLLLRGPVTDVLVTGGASKNANFIAFVYDSVAGYIYAYKNGSLNNSVAQSAINISGTGNFKVGGYATNTGLNKDGLIDEFRFYKKALSSKDVSGLMYSSSTYGSLTKQSLCSFTGPSGKHTWNRTGTYKDTIANFNGCDSIITVNLTITGNTTSTISPTACNYYISPSKKYYWLKSGTYSDFIKNKSNGCDSLITINLTIIKSSEVNFKVETCNSYKSPSGKYTWTQTGKYIDTIKNKVGCDSIMNFDLIVNYDQTNTINITACDFYTSPSGKSTWTSSGKYSDVIPTSKGCDSIITINLTVNKQIVKNITVKECNTYKSPSKKYIWTKTGTYNDTLKRKTGCDSILIIDLTINYTKYVNIAPQSCGNYKSPSGKYIWNQTGNYMDTIKTKAGCDSIIGIDLKINDKTTSTFSKTTCIEYYSPSGKHKWTKSGKYYDTIANKNGCDSIIAFNLTIIGVNIDVNQSVNILTSLANGAQYQWLNCSTNYSPIVGETGQTFEAKQIGNYAVQVKEYNCTDTSICYIVSKIGNVKSKQTNQIYVYPNPTSGEFIVNTAYPVSNATIKIFSVSGNLIFIKPNCFGLKNTIDISQFSNGIYYIEINEKDNIIHQKIMKF